MMSTAIAKTDKQPVRRFTPYEWRAYEAHKKALAVRKESSLSPLLSAQLFESFLQNRECADIARDWKGVQLGQVVAAAVDGDWHDRRDEYSTRLHERVVIRAEQAAAESVDFVADILSVAHKQHGAALRRYLSTGNLEDLDGFEVKSIDQYRKVIQTFLELTGHKPSGALTAPGKRADDAAPADGTSTSANTAIDFNELLASRRITPETAAALMVLISAPTTREKAVEVVPAAKGEP